MLKIINLVLLVTLFRSWVSCDCTFSNYKGGAIFLQDFGTKTLLLPNVQKPIVIPRWQNITAYCSGYFNDLCIKNRRYVKSDTVIISCKDKDREFSIIPYSYESTDNINCHTSQSVLTCSSGGNDVHEHPVAECPKSAYVVADTVQNVPVIYAEICYDLDKFTTEFIHFVVADRSPVLQRQVKYNPSFTSTALTSPNIGQKVDGFTLSESEKQIQLNSLLGNFSEVIDFESHSLVPKGLTYPFFDEPNYGNWSEVFWWKPLKKGNWNLYENLLKQKSKTVDIDVYAGTSHPLNFTYFDGCKQTQQLKFNVNSKVIPVPLYIWNYVRQRNSSVVIDVVVIGVNSPFVDDSCLNSAPVCKDICDAIDWLEQLKYTRRMSSLGLIFCCSPEEVKQILTGFPQAVVSTAVIDPVTNLTTEHPVRNVSNEKDESYVIEQYDQF